MNPKSSFSLLIFFVILGLGAGITYATYSSGAIVAAIVVGVVAFAVASVVSSAIQSSVAR